MRSVFESHGFPNTDRKKSFSPHLTIAKMSKYQPRWKKEKKKKFLRGIAQEHYEEFRDTNFGVERVCVCVCVCVHEYECASHVLN